MRLSPAGLCRAVCCAAPGTWRNTACFPSQARPPGRSRRGPGRGGRERAVSTDLGVIGFLISFKLLRLPSSPSSAKSDRQGVLTATSVSPGFSHPRGYWGSVWSCPKSLCGSEENRIRSLPEAALRPLAWSPPVRTASEAASRTPGAFTPARRPLPPAHWASALAPIQENTAEGPAVPPWEHACYLLTRSRPPQRPSAGHQRLAWASSAPAAPAAGVDFLRPLSFVSP